MRIVDIRERAVPLKSNIANSSFDFSEMTTSVVAVITDVVRDGRPVVGFAFNSTGRYACGAAMRARFIPRILSADPRSLLDGSQENFDPGKVLAVMMQREKSGGHSERSIANRHDRGGRLGRGCEDCWKTAPSTARRAL
jgi:D(-)-tartrate dehydratase